MKLSEIEKLAKEATEGQWRVWNFDIVHSHLKNAVGRPFMIASCFSCSGEAEVEHANAVYIAEANPTNILTLCATFREMLEAMRIANAAIVQYTPCAEEECKQVQTEIGDLAERRLLSAIKKAEEML